MRITSRSHKYTVRFNSDSLIALFGGPASVYEILAASGAKLSERTPEQWRLRDNIPAEAVATLLLHASRHGIKVEILDHLLEREG